MIITIFDKIRSICKECQGVSVPHKRSIQEITNQHYDQFVRVLDNIKINNIGKCRTSCKSSNRNYASIQEQQKFLSQLEQQLKLYIDSLKIQLQQSENQKIQLLENSKLFIKELKRQNQRLYAQIKPFKRQTLATDHVEHSGSKKKKNSLTERNPNQSYSASQKQKQNSKKKDKLGVSKTLLSSKKKKQKLTPIKSKKQIQNKPKKKVPMEPKKHHVSVFKFYQGSKQKHKLHHHHLSNHSVSSLELKKSRKL